MRKKSFRRRLLYKTQSALVHGLYSLHKSLPLDISSAMGGFIGCLIGPIMKNSKYAERNLDMVFPLLPKKQKRIIINSMWNNLGRTICELPFISSGEVSKRAEFEGMENLEELKRMGKPAIFVSAHFGNWELLPQIAKEAGFPLTLIYRSVNNRPLDKLLLEIRKPIYRAMFPKGSRGAINMIRALSQGHSMAILVDQKMNSGIEVPFFGRTSMTSSAVAELALKNDLPIVMARVIRIGSRAKFKIIIDKPFFVQNTGNRKQDVFNTMKRINEELESWIRENPDMWFWVHRRWSKEFYL